MTSPGFTTGSRAAPCYESPIPEWLLASSPPPMVDVERSAVHAVYSAPRGLRAEAYFHMPSGLQQAAEEHEKTESWLADRGSGVRKVPPAESYLSVPPSVHQATEWKRMMDNWLTGQGLGGGFRQCCRSDCQIGAPPGLCQAVPNEARTGNWLAGHSLGKDVRQKSQAGSYTAAQSCLHQGDMELNETVNWQAGFRSGRGVPQGPHAESYFRSPPGLRHPAEEEYWKENWSARVGAVPPPPLSDSSMFVTTLLVHNLHRRLLQEEILRILPSDRFNYDMLFLMFDLKQKRSSGRLFINFTTHNHALQFQAQFHGKPDVVLSGTDDHGYRKPLLVEAARRQGLDINVAHWQRRLRQDAPVSTFPALFVGGNRLYFWEYRIGLSHMQ